MIVSCEVCVRVSCVVSDGGLEGVKIVGFGFVSCVDCVGGSCCIISDEGPERVQWRGFVIVSCEVCGRVSCVVSDGG